MINRFKEQKYTNESIQQLSCKDPQDKIIQILSTYDVYSRSIKQIKCLVQILQKIQFFMPIHNNYRVLYDVCTKMQYKKINPNELVYKIKSSAEYFYFLIKGEINLTISEQHESISNNTQPQIVSHNQQSQILTFQPVNSRISDLQHHSQTKQEHTKQDRIIKIIESGQCFGQIMGEKSLRVTNAKAVAQSHVIMFKKNIYDSLFKAQLKTQNRTRFNFFSSLPIFANLSQFSRESLSLFMSEVNLGFNQLLYKQGEKINNIYVIKQGEFKLHKQITKKSLENIKKQCKNMSFHKQIFLATKVVPFRIVQPGQILGQVQLFQKIQNYRQTCTCETKNGIIYQMNKKQFVKIIDQDANNKTEAIKKIIQDKKQRKQAVAKNFVIKRTTKSITNNYLNNQSYKRIVTSPSQFVDDPLINMSMDQFYRNEGLFFNNFNKTITKVVNRNRFSLKEQNKRSRSPSLIDKLISQKRQKKIYIPKSVKDIVQLVNLKSSFQKKCSRGKKKIKSLFKFDSNNVPLYIKSKYSLI